MEPRVRPRPCYTEALLTTPYGGYCPINCGHCYVNNGTRGYRATGLPVVHNKYPAAIRRQLANIMVSGAAYITSFSEPFHPLEEEYGITRDLSQVFVDAGLPLFYLSRMLPPDWALDMLQENPYSYMQWSVNTGNPDHYKRMCPGSFTIPQVLKRIREVSDRGIFVSIQCNPIMAGITTLKDLVNLVTLVSQAGGHHMIFKFVEQVSNNRKIIVQRMNERGLPHVAEFDRLFNQVIGGVYTIQQDVRIEWLKVLLQETRDVDISMSLCYEYYTNGKAGANMAPWFTTSDQCHGRGVPVYYRPEPGEKFQPLEGCYRKGCLYCADFGTQACANEQLVQATALAYKDLRSIRIENPTGEWADIDSCLEPGECAKSGTQLDWYTNLEMKTDAETWKWPVLEDVIV